MFLDFKYICEDFSVHPAIPLLNIWDSGSISSLALNLASGTTKYNFPVVSAGRSSAHAGTESSEQ